MSTNVYANSLPVCNILSKSTKIYNENNFQDFITFLKDAFNEQCKALIINNQQIFNSYLNKDLNENIDCFSYRNKIINNPNEFIRNNLNNTIEIYRFDECSYKHTIHFKNNKEIIVEHYISQGFYEAYGDDFE